MFLFYLLQLGLDLNVALISALIILNGRASYGFWYKLCVCILTVLERRYPKVVQDLYDAMRRFARVMGPLEHDKFIEAHACEYCIIVFLSYSLFVLHFGRNHVSRTFPTFLRSLWKSRMIWSVWHFYHVALLLTVNTNAWGEREGHGRGHFSFIRGLVLQVK